MRAVDRTAVSAILATLRLLPPLLVLAVLSIATGFAAEPPKPKTVLVIHSFGRDIAPYHSITATFRTELARRMPDPVVLFETTLDAERPVRRETEAAFVEYLRTRFVGSAPDLVMTIGPPAARFYLERRDELFQSPLLMTALDERLAREVALRPGDAAVVGKVDLPGLVENILRVLPGTRRVAVVIGASASEQYWLKELQREVTRYVPRVDFLWLSDLSLEQMKDRVARLPSNSAVLYGLMIVDAAGVPHERDEALTELRAASNAPIFGLYESELGGGVVGGPYSSQRAHGEDIADLALRILQGGSEPAAEPQIRVTSFETPVYDWRELRHWGIDPARLPPGSEIRFRPPSLWQQHKAAIVVTLGVISFQTVLIAGLLWQRLGRRRAEREARSLGGRLITAHEDERRRLARELHDDFTQRLAALAIQTTAVERNAATDEGKAAMADVRERLVELSEDVHAMSYRLHPTVIEDLGLVEALRAECDRVSGSGPLRVELEADAISPRLPEGVGVGLFRVGQEALRNVVRHANASQARVALRRVHGRLILAVSDNGSGIADMRRLARGSVGIASMRERMRLLGGALEIHSEAGHGTTVTAWVPLPEAA